MSLIADFDHALAQSADLAMSNYLQRAREDVLLIEAQAAGCTELSTRATHLRKLLGHNDFSLNPVAINQFLQDLYETQFFALCKMRGISLNSVPTRSRPTPDYNLAADDETTFEVKTLSVVRGQFGLESDLYSDLDAKVSLEAQLRKGDRIAISERETTAYGGKVRGTHTNFDHINVLLEKVRQNIKPEQYSAPRSFLVLNTSILPVLGSRSEALRPVHWSESPAAHPVSGAMWMVAFARKGMAVFGYPEFEGMPVIEDHFLGDGILLEHADISGVIVVRREMNGNLFVGALVRSLDVHAWLDDEKISSWFNALVQNNWNDELDSNGWRL